MDLKRNTNLMLSTHMHAQGTNPYSMKTYTLKNTELGQPL